MSVQSRRPLAPRTFDRFQRLVGPPERPERPVGVVAAKVQRRPDRGGQGLDVGQAEPLRIGSAVEDLQGGDLVLVLAEERLERRDQSPGPLPRVGRVAGLDDRVLADGVDRLLVPLRLRPR